MNYRELLELAAKAARYDPVGFEAGKLVIGPHGNCRYWNPLDDDGDALRLAYQLKISISYSGDRHDVRIGRPSFDVCALGDLSDIRIEIVRAAAEIGRSMT